MVSGGGGAGGGDATELTHPDTRTAPKDLAGTTVRKHFPGYGWFMGVVTGGSDAAEAAEAEPKFRVQWHDGTDTIMSHAAVLKVAHSVRGGRAAARAAGGPPSVPSAVVVLGGGDGESQPSSSSSAMDHYSSNYSAVRACSPATATPADSPMSVGSCCSSSSSSSSSSSGVGAATVAAAAASRKRSKEKRCKCGSTAHLRSNALECPLNARNKKRGAVTDTDTQLTATGKSPDDALIIM